MEGSVDVVAGAGEGEGDLARVGIDRESLVLGEGA
jgi:hypothetical protein